MIIGFRTDANERIATGHLMRCITIAGHCRELGADCIFFLAENKFTDLLDAHDLKYRVLNIDCYDWEKNFERMTAAFRACGVDKLVIDSYQPTPAVLSKFMRLFPTLYFDDIRDQIYPATAVVSYSIWSEDDHPILQRYRAAGFNVLWSPKYCPLRDEFSAPPSTVERKKQILILTGGSDPHHVTLKLIERLLETRALDAFSIQAILGRSNVDRERIARLAGEFPSKIFWRQGVNNISQFMRESSMAVSAGGITLYELLCACGVPTVCFSMNEEQAYLCRKMSAHGMMKYAGDVSIEGTVDDIAQRLAELSTDEAFKNRAVEKMTRLVDGNGARRIAKAIIEL